MTDEIVFAVLTSESAGMISRLPMLNKFFPSQLVTPVVKTLDRIAVAHAWLGSYAMAFKMRTSSQQYCLTNVNKSAINFVNSLRKKHRVLVQLLPRVAPALRHVTSHQRQLKFY